MIKRALINICKKLLDKGYTEKQVIEFAKKAGWDVKITKKMLEELAFFEKGMKEFTGR